MLRRGSLKSGIGQQFGDGRLGTWIKHFGNDCTSQNRHKTTLLQLFYILCVQLLEMTSRAGNNLGGACPVCITGVNLLIPPLHKPRIYNAYTGYRSCTCVDREGIWRVEAELHIFLILTVHGNKFSASRPNRSISSEGAVGAHCIGESVGPKVSMGGTEKWKISTAYS